MHSVPLLSRLFPPLKGKQPIDRLLCRGDLPECQFLFRLAKKDYAASIVTGRTRGDMLRLSRNFNFNFIISQVGYTATEPQL